MHFKTVALNIDNVCIFHFQDDDIEHTYIIRNPDGSLNEIPRGQVELKTGHSLLYIGSQSNMWILDQECNERR